MKKYVLLLIFILSISIFSTMTVTAAQVHRVEPGDSIYYLAVDYGVMVDEIISTNNLRAPYIIFPGQVLVIPEQSVYHIQKGDTLYEISEKLNVNLESLIEKNYINNSDMIFPGQTLLIPESETKIEHQALKTSVITYEVEPGDSLYSISHEFGVSIQNIASLNNISDINNIRSGQILNIPEYTYSELERMYPDNFFVSGNSEEKKVALTFDDGPDDIYTPKILDVLDEHDIPATFFYMGEHIDNHQEVVERTIEEDHIIANHSETHPELTKISDLEVYEEIKQPEISMEELTGHRTRLFRPPYGLISQKIIEQLKEIDYQIIQWSVDSLDWLDKDVDQILINTIPDISEGAIILFHSAGGNQSFQPTVDALPELIFTLEVQGYEFVTIDELLEIPAYINS